MGNKNSKKWSDATSFEDMLEINLRWENMEIYTHPFWGRSSMTEEKIEYFRNQDKHKYAMKLNKLGYLTFVLREGGERNHYPDHDVIRLRSRANVTGVMKKDMALKLVDKLKDKEVIIEYTTQENSKGIRNNYEEEYEYSELPFHGDKIMLDEIRQSAKIWKENNKNGTLRLYDKYLSCTYFSGHSLGCWSQKYGTPHVDKKNQITDKLYDKLKDEIVSFAIMDKQWGRNDYLWDLLISAIEEINK